MVWLWYQMYYTTVVKAELIKLNAYDAEIKF